MRFVVRVACLSMLACALLPASAAALSRQEAPFCEPRVLVDREARLSHLPDVREPPVSRRLPFAPRVRLHSVSPGFRSPQAWTVAGDGIRWRLALSEDDGSLKRLGWTIRSRLVRVDRRGRGHRVVKRRSDAIGGLLGGHWWDFGFGRVVQPGLFRYDMIFRTRERKVLARYHRFYLVVPDVSNVQLALDGSAYRAGDTVYGQLRNFGTRSITYGAGFAIERFDGAAWAPIDYEAVFGHMWVFILIGYGLGGGMSDDCSTGFTVPDAMEPGLYRVVKRLTVQRGRRQEEAIASAELTIVPPA